MIESVVVGSWVTLAVVRVLPDLIRSRRTGVTVTLTIRPGGGREVAVAATNVDDASRLVQKVLAVDKPVRPLRGVRRRRGPGSGPGRGGRLRACPPGRRG